MSMPNELPYTSPPRKLIRFFLKSRDQWKTKCQSAKTTVKRLENRVRFLETSKEKWKTKAKVVEAENARLKAQVQQMSLHQDAQAFKKKPLPPPSHS